MSSTCNIRSSIPFPSENPPASLQDIIGNIAPYLAEVEKILETAGGESEGILKDASRYVLTGSGKRLRPALVIYSASLHPDALRLPDSRARIIAAAAAVELIHAGTLVHDDIIDHAAMRRLKPVAAVKYGEEISILLGDFLYAKAFGIISSIGDPQVTSWIAETTRQMCEGEIGQFQYRYRNEMTLEEYFSFIEKKTAGLIAVSARCGAYLAGLASEAVEQLSTFAFNVGISYQIADDLTDIMGSEESTGKTLRTDVENGKMTLPTLLLLDAADEKEKGRFLKDFYTEPDWVLIRSLMEKYKVAEKTEKVADQYYHLAIDQLRSFTPEVRENLICLSRLILGRTA